MTISRKAFIQSALAISSENELRSYPRADGEKWKGPRSLAAALPHAPAFKYIAHDKISAYWISGGLQNLFLLHAPVSARVFAYFDCARLGKRWFLRSDYKLECYSESWYAFFPVAISLLVSFSLALPTFSIGYMYKNRHKIRSPVFRERVGFLMVPFRHGVEWWEIQEILRKMILTGLIIYFPESLRKAVAMLVCALALTLLSYFRPHLNRIVFWVIELSYFLTATKYVAATLQGSGRDGTLTKDEAQMLGGFLITIDVTCYICFWRTSPTDTTTSTTERRR